MILSELHNTVRSHNTIESKAMAASFVFANEAYQENAIWIAFFYLFRIDHILISLDKTQMALATVKTDWLGEGPFTCISLF
jgi:hypothetical protein